MIEGVVEFMYRRDDDTKFLEVTYQNGDKELLYFRDFSSGAMIENIVRRAKTFAIKRFLDTGERGIRSDDLLAAVTATSSKSTKICQTPPTPTIGPRCPARRASASFMCAR
ncbi:MAG: hypothetical protein R2706_09105 [Acidimicrobiales bacterium]